MKRFQKFFTACGAGVALLFFASTGIAQMQHKIGFMTDFPFYVGNAEMPAGTYIIRQPQTDTNLLQLQSKDGMHEAFIDVLPTTPDQAYKHTNVTFNRYDHTDFLRRISLGGQRFGYRVAETRAEEHEAAHTKAVEHSVNATAD
ncbi:MAG: hypothetical protein WBY53_17225 [Acidobacteriaceae bacterium]